jgi:nucleoside-diphosphate-sugar epimerase
VRILITGINSALGGAVADRLAGHKVLGLGRKENARHLTLVADLRDGVPDLPNLDVCLHLAAITDPQVCRQRYREAYAVNVAATARLLEKARRFVLVSTGSVCGYQDGPVDEGRQPQPADEYARLKCLAEAEAARHPNAAVLRYFFPYGPGTRADTLVNRIIRSVSCGSEVELHAGGRPWINPAYITDVAAATALFCLNDARGTYNVAGLEVVSIRGLAEGVGRLLGKRPLFRPSGKTVKDLVGSTQRLGPLFRPAVGLAEGLGRTVASCQPLVPPAGAAFSQEQCA